MLLPSVTTFASFFPPFWKHSLVLVSEVECDQSLRVFLNDKSKKKMTKKKSQGSEIRLRCLLLLRHNPLTLCT